LPAALAALAAGAANAPATTSTFDVAATLDWRQQVPRPVHPVRVAAGSLSGDLDHQRREVHWTLVYRRLSGKATAAEVHVGARGRRGPLLVALCGRTAPKARPCSPGATGTATLSADAVGAFEAGNTYVVVQTRSNPAGEIRGQIAVKR
jgi:hypothetical protein